MRFTKLTFIFVFIAFALFSCKKSNEKTNWDVDVVAPLVNSSLDINNLVTDTLLSQNSDGSLKLVFDADLYEFKVDSLIQLPDTVLTFPFTLGIPFPYTLVPGYPLFTKTTETTYNTGGLELNKLILKSGNLEIYVENDYEIPVKVLYKVNSASKNSVVFAQNLLIPAAAGGVPGVLSQTFDISDYTVNFTGASGTKINTVSTTFVITICDTVTCPGVQNTVVYPGDSVKIRNGFVDMIPAYAKGYFGKQTIDIAPQETSIDVFKGIKGGALKLSDATINFSVSNGIGVDTRLTVNSLQSINTKTNTTVDLTGSLVGTAQNINRATETGNSSDPVNYATKNIVLNSANSNAKNLLENLPDKLGYSLKIVTNPYGNLSGSNDFIYYGEGIKASMNMEIPLQLSTTDLLLLDTADVDLSELKDKTRINHGTLNLHVYNGFPFHATVQVYLFDANFNITDSLLIPASATAYAGNIDANYKVTSKRLTTLPIVIDKDLLFKLFDTKKMLIKATFNTAEQPALIKLYSNYGIDFKLTGDFNYNVQLKK